MLRLHLSFRCHRQGHERPRLQVVLSGCVGGFVDGSGGGGPAGDLGRAVP